jgi:histidyl-tRNA synthetase
MVAYEPELVKGFPEFLPPESIKYEKVRKIVQKQYENYGFLPIKTPMIEFDELMRSEKLSGEEDEAVSERFKFQDRGGRNIGLRYEFTFQLARIFKQHPNIKLPFRRFQIGSVFRDEPTSTGRFKEFVQCDADIVGDASIEADAECLAAGNSIVQALNIPADIHVNNKKLMFAILESINLQKKHEILRELDKIDKIGEDVVKTNLKKYADTNQILTLFKLLEKDFEFFVKNLFDGADDLFKLQELVKQYGFMIKYDPFLVRGLSYYTGNVFELKVAGTKNAIGGGGRYDKVVGKYLSKEIPSVGISFGLERLADLAQITIENNQALVISLGKDREARTLVQKMRKEGAHVVISTDKVGKAMEYANSYNIRYVIFLGEEEIKKKKVKMKDMMSGKEQWLTEKQLIDKVATPLH